MSNPVVEYNPGMLGPAGVCVARVPGLTKLPRPFEAIREAAAPEAMWSEAEDANALPSSVWPWKLPLPEMPPCWLRIESWPKLMRELDANADEFGNAELGSNADVGMDMSRGPEVRWELLLLFVPLFPPPPLLLPVVIPPCGPEGALRWMFWTFVMV
jgi:hypothetical protein